MRTFLLYRALYNSFKVLPSSSSLDLRDRLVPFSSCSIKQSRPYSTGVMVASMEEHSVNGVEKLENPIGKFPSSKIDILVIGAGTAGLYLALECVRQGHRPTVIESKPEDTQPFGMSCFV